jgi:hypothetical protein
MSWMFSLPGKGKSLLSEAPSIDLTPCQAMGLYLQLKDISLDYCLGNLLHRIEKEILDHLSIDERVNLENIYQKLCKEEGAECK